MRKTLLLTCIHSIAAILVALILTLGLTGCATKTEKPNPERDAYILKRTKYYLGEGGLSNESTAMAAATADWESGVIMEDADKRLGIGAYSAPQTKP